MINSDSISVIIPVYNSEATLNELFERLVATLAISAAKFEIIFINDGSSDSSWEVIRQLALRRRFVVGMDLGRNYGQHNALLAGIRAAKNEIIVTLDDDLQNPPEEIPKLLSALQPGVDVVYGAREKEQHGFFRDCSSRFVKLCLSYFLGIKIAKVSSSFRAFRAHLRDGFQDYRCDFISIDVLLSWSTSRFSSIIVTHHPRALGKSNYSAWKLYKHALNMLTGFTTLPLQLATAIGLTFTSLGILVFLYVLYNYFWLGNKVPGFAFLSSLVSIFSGATLFSVGILGEYLARIYSRALNRPTFTVRETLGNTGSPHQKVKFQDK